MKNWLCFKGFRVADVLRITSYSLTIRAFQALLLVMCTVFLGLAYAQPIPATCDADYMDVLDNRSWLEGKRQFEFAQKLILKQDSVLQYTCFPQRMVELDNPGANWSNRKTPPLSGGMRAVLNRLVGSALFDYLGRNFAHTMGGGTTPVNWGPCDTMFRIWNALRCDNFNKSDFMTFAQLIDNDPRLFHQPCQEAGRSDKWEDAIEVAFPLPDLPSSAGSIDRLEASFGLIGGACNQVDPISTGVWVVPDVGDPNEEHVGVPPGCTYNPGSGNCQ